MLLRAMRCVAHAVRRKWDGADDKAAHWVERARDRFDGSLIRDVKITLRVLLLFCTYPLFWALFYQTSTGMIFQAKRLDGRVGESYRIPPEMSSTINPLLILTLIPLFDQVIYPLLGRLGVLTSTTSRMIAGMAFAVSSFVVYAIVNMSVEQTLIPSTHARLHVYNALPCEAALHLPPELHLVDEDGERMAKKELMIPLAGQVALPNVEVGGAPQKVEVQVSRSCAAGSDLTPVQVVLLGAHESSVVLTAAGPRPLAPSLEYLKNEDAEAKVSPLRPIRSWKVSRIFFFSFFNVGYLVISFCLIRFKYSVRFDICIYTIFRNCVLIANLSHMHCIRLNTVI